ncbi:MAG: lysozyme inhibitor LprI family protein [Beijerinckiaceae bacterium]
MSRTASIFAAVIISLATTSVRAQDVPATVNCDVRMQPREYGECIRKAQEDSDRAMRDHLQAILTVVDATSSMPGPQKIRWKKAIDDSHAMWMRFRNGECQELTMFETPNKARIAEEQRLCLISHNVRRMDEWRKRYPTVTAGR